MLINRDSRIWIIICFVIFIIATAAYIPYAHNASRLGGASGGTWPGIIYGSVGSAMMLFALLLGLKKRVRTMRIGRAYIWLQGHIWFGLLAYPIILFHSGWRFGGTFTSILMWLFTLVVVSGIFGVILQQFLPTKILRDVKFETIFDQIHHVLEQLRGEAEALVHGIVDDSGGEAFELEVMPAGVATATLPERSVIAAKTLEDFYVTHVKPFLADHIPAGSPLAAEAGSRVFFEQVRTTLPKSLHEAVNDLALIVEERRQLATQKRMHYWLHGWLLVHVPASYGLMILATFHAVEALRYVSPHW